MLNDTNLVIIIIILQLLLLFEQQSSVGPNKKVMASWVIED